MNCSSSDDSGEMPDDSGNTDNPDNPTNPIPNKTTTFDGDIKVLVDQHCIQCHTEPRTQGATFPMRNYQEIVNAYRNSNRDIFGRVETTGRNVMPPAGRLSQDDVDLFLDWRADGLLEN